MDSVAELNTALTLNRLHHKPFPAIRGATIYVEGSLCSCEVQAPTSSPVLLEAVGEVALEGSAMMNVTADGVVMLTNTGDAPIDAT